MTFETDQFSTYALAYTDAPETKVEAPEKPDTSNNNAISTGDKINIGLIVMLMIDSVMAALYLTLRRRMIK